MRVKSDRYDTNVAMIAELEGFEGKAGEPFSYGTATRRYRLDEFDNRMLLFDVLLQLAHRVPTKVWQHACDQVAQFDSTKRMIEKAKARERVQDAGGTSPTPE